MCGCSTSAGTSSLGLDYAYSLLVGVPESSLRRCQVVQNDAGRMIARMSRRQHISPILQSTLAAYQATNLLETINASIHGAHIGECPELPRGSPTSASTDDGVTMDTSPADCAADCQVRRDAILSRCWSNTTEYFTSSPETLEFI